MFVFHLPARRLSHVSRCPTIELALQEWIAKKLAYYFRDQKVESKRIWNNALPPNSGGGVVSISKINFLYSWRKMEDMMQLNIRQLTKPIEVWVVMLDFYSPITKGIIGSEPVGVWFTEDLAEAFKSSFKKAEYEDMRIRKVTTTGVAGLQDVIDSIIAEG